MATPPRMPDSPKSSAVAIDCEMVSLKNLSTSLIQLCAVDYLTGATLIDRLVQPPQRVRDWRTQYSGVSPQMVDEATARGDVFSSWRAARDELLKYVDADTIIVGHALHNDLDALRLMHGRVVDSAILVQEIAKPYRLMRQWSLKTLCQELLLTEVQSQERRGHNCLEDTLAARELILWCTREVKQLRAWAILKWKEQEIKVAEQRARKAEIGSKARK